MSHKEDKEYKRFTVSVPTELYDEFEDLREEIGEKISRSDLIRKAMHMYMIEEKQTRHLEQNIVGCIILTMKHEHFDPRKEHSHDHDDTHTHDDHDQEDHDHPHEHDLKHLHEHDYSSQPIYASVQQADLLLMNDIQHHFTDIILSSVHYHLEFEKCMEIITVAGPYERFKKLKDYLKRLRSVISIKDVVIS